MGNDKRAGRGAPRGRPGRRGVRLYVAAAIALLAGIVAYGLGAVGPGNVQGGVGPAPDVTLHTDQGALPLSGTRGEILVLYFSFPG